MTACLYEVLLVEGKKNTLYISLGLVKTSIRATNENKIYYPDWASAFSTWQQYLKIKMDQFCMKISDKKHLESAIRMSYR